MHDTPLVLVHGLSGSPRWWDPVLPLLERDDVRVLHLRRFSRSHGVEAAEAEIASELDGGGQLVGHSLGGLLAARVAAQRPDLVQRLVLVAPAGAHGEATLWTHGRRLARTLHGLGVPLLRTLVADALRWGPEALLVGAVAAVRTKFTGTVAVPTLLVWGDRDPLVPVELAPEWLSLLPTARLEILHGAGHLPMLDAPSEFARILLRFLDEPDDGAGAPERCG
jgi:pimeloyl-ACP methyl ester carboxylesterase